MSEAKDLTRVETKQTATSLIQIIERVATMPEIDVDKLERMLAMQERILDRTAEAEFNEAFSNMQAELPSIDKEGKIVTPRERGSREMEVRGKYMKFEDISEIVKPILQRHGFGITFRTESAKGATLIEAILRHRGGHKEKSSLELPADTTGSKNSVQAIGSAISYGKRYTLCAILNITAAGEDDNGQSAVAEPVNSGSRSDQVLNRAQQQRRQPQQDARPAAQRQPPAQPHAPEVSADPGAADAVPALPGDTWPESIRSPEDLAKMGIDELLPIAESLTVEIDGSDIDDSPQGEQLARGRLVAAIQSAYEQNARPALKNWAVDLISKFADCTAIECGALLAEAERIRKPLVILAEKPTIDLLRGAAKNAKKRTGLDQPAEEATQS